MPAFLPSELPVRCRTQHHWIVLLRPPRKGNAITLGILFLVAVVWPTPMAWIFGVYAASLALLRWQTWQAEWVILTGKRVIRVQGVPETTKTEASLRLDRVSGVRLVETVPGKLLGYGTIELEAPGDHPGVRRLIKINDPHDFYLELRQVVFGDRVRLDPDDDPRDPNDFVTEPLPDMGATKPMGRKSL